MNARGPLLGKALKSPFMVDWALKNILLSIIQSNLYDNGLIAGYWVVPWVSCDPLSTYFS